MYHEMAMQRAVHLLRAHKLCVILLVEYETIYVWHFKVFYTCLFSYFYNFPKYANFLAGTILR